MQPGPETTNELRKRFNYHKPPNELVVKAHEDVRCACFVAATTVVECTPDGCEQAWAIHKLEEAMFWANAAIARGHEDFVLENRETEPGGGPPGVDRDAEGSCPPEPSPPDPNGYGEPPIVETEPVERPG